MEISAGVVLGYTLLSWRDALALLVRLTLEKKLLSQVLPALVGSLMPPSPCLAFWGTCMNVRDEDTAAMTFLLESGWKEGYISGYLTLSFGFDFFFFCFFVSFYLAQTISRTQKEVKSLYHVKMDCKDFVKTCVVEKEKTSQEWVRHNLGTADAACSGQSGLGGTV